MLAVFQNLEGQASAKILATSLRLVAATGLSLSLSGCLWMVFGATNDVRPGQLSDRRAASAQIVYGVAVETDWPFEAFSIGIDRYDPETRRAGSCEHYDRASAPVPPRPTGVHYFVFDVPPGAYIFSPLNGQSLDSDSPAAFVVSPGKTVYLGDYVLVGPVTPYHFTEDGPIEVRRDFEVAKAALGPAAEHMQLAEVLPGVRRGTPVLCMP
jgi:hypothetical protein